MADENVRIFGFEIQHIFPNELLTNPEAAEGRAFLQSIDFDFEARGNKIALLRTAETRDALLDGPPDILQAFRDAGFGLNTQNSIGNLDAHPGYNAFIIDAMNNLASRAEVGDWDEKARERAIFDLFDYVDEINKTGSIDLMTSPKEAFLSGWQARSGGVDYGDLSEIRASALDAIHSAFDQTPIDEGSNFNSKLRYDIGEKLYTNLQDKLSSAELENALKALSKAGADGSNPGNLTQAVISLIHDAQAKSASYVSGTQAIAEYIGALLKNENGALDLDVVIDQVSKAIEAIKGYASSFADTFDKYGKSMFEAVGKSLPAMLKSVGLNEIANIVIFMDEAYEPIKKGFQTGDWSDLGPVVVKFGVGAVVGAVLIAGGIAAATALAAVVVGPEAALVVGEFVAAGFAAYGLYVAVEQGADLIKKIGSDLASVIGKVGQQIEEGLLSAARAVELFTRIIANTMGAEFDSPFFPSHFDPQSLVHQYLVDPQNSTLPGSVTGSSGNERFYGKNDAVIDAGAGNDEIYVQDVATAFGGAGNDILDGGKARYVTQGTLIDPTNPNSELASSDLQMLLDGGADSDWVIAVGGEKAITAGGLGRDWIYNTSSGGEIWGDVQGSVNLGGGHYAYFENGQQVDIADGHDNSDNFWYAPDVTIMDAQHSDVLKFYGLPLTGGDANGGLMGLGINGVAGAAIGLANAAQGNLSDWTKGVYFDHLFPWMTYQFQRNADGNLDLYITNQFDQVFRAFFAIPGFTDAPSDGPLHGYMKVANVDVVGSRLGSQQFGLEDQGSLGMVFRAVNPLQMLLPILTMVPGAIGAVLYYSVYADTLASTAAAISRAAKAAKWSSGGDPLVIDLDGDGIETISLNASSTYFDVDGDLFRERTGWLKGDDGFLVLDANGNGRVDDISEMFGNRFQGGYDELAAYDSNGDGKITMADAVWASLQVWQDKNRDGVTQDGELKTLDQLGITELSLIRNRLSATTSAGGNLQADSSVTFADGRVSTTFCKEKASNDNGTSHRALVARIVA